MDLVVVCALVFVCTVCVAVFFYYTEPGTEIAFQRVPHGKTGEPISIAGSLLVYGFIGSIAYGLFASALCVVVVEPIVAIYQIIKKLNVPRLEFPPGMELGFAASFILGAVTFLVVGVLLCFGVRVI